MSDRCVIPNYANKNKQSPEQRIPRDGNGYAARFRRVAVARVLPDGNQTMTAIMRMLATVLVLWPAGAFAQAEYLTLKSWTACPTIQNTNEMLVFDGYSADCEPIRAGSRMIVEQAEQAPATRWMCIDHPAAHGTFTLCKLRCTNVNCAAVHESAVGTKRRFVARHKNGRYRSQRNPGLSSASRSSGCLLAEDC